MKDAAKPRSGAEVFRIGLEQEWGELLTLLRKLPPWFRISQFLLALGAGENLKSRTRAIQRLLTHRKAKAGASVSLRDQLDGAETVEAFCSLWYEVLDPIDRALLEQQVGLHDDEPEETALIAATKE